MSVLFVAEILSNHNQDLTRALRLIDKAAEIGCGAVKFQLFRLQELFAPEVLIKSKEHLARQSWELPQQFLPRLAEHCRKLDIQFACTPFYLEAVEHLRPYVSFYKIASYELLWDDLLTTCARTQKPVVLSTGMANMKEVQRAVDVLRQEDCQSISLLHCVSAYPTAPEECNLAALETLRTTYSYPVGWSDHSVNPGVIYRAVHRWGANLVEFHLDLEGQGAEYSSGHCWLPDEIAPVIRSIQSGLVADGNGHKMPSPSEGADRDWRAEPSDGLRPVITARQAWRV